jgi:hypothetical protein
MLIRKASRWLNRARPDGRARLVDTAVIDRAADETDERHERYGKNHRNRCRDWRRRSGAPLCLDDLVIDASDMAVTEMLISAGISGLATE